MVWKGCIMLGSLLSNEIKWEWVLSSFLASVWGTLKKGKGQHWRGLYWTPVQFPSRAGWFFEMKSLHVVQIGNKINLHFSQSSCVRSIVVSYHRCVLPYPVLVLTSSRGWVDGKCDIMPGLVFQVQKGIVVLDWVYPTVMVTGLSIDLNGQSLS